MWFREEGEEKKGVLMYRVMAAAAGRFLMQESQNDEVWIRRLEGLTARVARHEMLGGWVDTKAMTISLPQPKVDDLVKRLRASPPRRKGTTGKEVLVLAEKLNHATYVVWPGWYLANRLLQLSGMH